MLLQPHIIAAGVYRQPEKACQTIPCRWLVFYVRGVVRDYVYWPDGKLKNIFSADAGARLSLAFPGMKTDFEYGPERENWVVMLDWEALGFDAASHCFRIDTPSGPLPVPAELAIAPDEIPTLRMAFKRLTDYIHSSLPRHLAAADLLLAGLLARFLEEPEVDTPAARLRRLIDADEQWHHSLEELSRQAGGSRDHLRRLFFERYRITPGEYRIQKRLKKILHLFAYSDLSLKEIAFAAGMRNVTHLNALIRQHCGKTPTAVRRRYRS